MSKSIENSTKIGVVIGAYDRDVEYVGELASALKACGYYVVLCYDARESLPDIQTVNSCDAFVSGGGHKVRPNGHLRNMKNGHRILADIGCEYSLSLTGDAVLDKPEGITDLIGTLNGSDVIAAQWNKAVSTMVNFGKTEILNAAFQDMSYGHPQNEKKLKKALDNHGAKYTIYPCGEDNKGIWQKIGYWRRHGNYRPLPG